MNTIQDGFDEWLAFNFSDPPVKDGDQYRQLRQAWYGGVLWRCADTVGMVARLKECERFTRDVLAGRK